MAMQICIAFLDWAVEDFYTFSRLTALPMGLSTELLLLLGFFQMEALHK
jgi:hypothetical protein